MAVDDRAQGLAGPADHLPGRGALVGEQHGFSGTAPPEVDGDQGADEGDAPLARGGARAGRAGAAADLEQRGPDLAALLELGLGGQTVPRAMPASAGRANAPLRPRRKKISIALRV